MIGGRTIFSPRGLIDVGRVMRIGLSSFYRLTQLEKLGIADAQRFGRLRRFAVIPWLR
jgi:hypothetical protein